MQASLKPRLIRHFNDLCYRQTDGNRTRPEIDNLASVLTEFRVEKDIGPVKAATRPEYSQDFLKGALLSRNQVDDAASGDHIYGALSTGNAVASPLRTSTIENFVR